MSVNFSAYFQHQLSIQQAKGIKEILNQEKFFNKFLELGDIYDNYRAKIGINKWKWDDKYYLDLPDSNDFVRLGMLVGPDYYIISFGKNMFEITHCARWNTFISDKQVQYYLRKVCFLFHQLFGKPVYIADCNAACDFLEEGTMNDMLNFLYQRHGEPNKTIDSIRYINYEKGWNGYYIDDFNDFNILANIK